MDPFEPGVIAAAGLHATSTRQIAERITRQVQGQTYHFFYNPMWGHFGDRTPGPPGTFYYGNSSMTSLFWNMFDQVLVRPELLPHFPEAHVEIITSIQVQNLLLASGRPDDNRASDHLPISFIIEMIGGIDEHQGLVGRLTPT